MTETHITNELHNLYYIFYLAKWLQYRTRNFQVAGLNLTAGHLQATLGKLLIYGVLRTTQPPTIRGTGNE